MNNFKPGDRVECVSDDDYGLYYKNGLRKGNIYTIRSCDGHGFCALSELSISEAFTARFKLVSTDKVFIVGRKSKDGSLSLAPYPYQHPTRVTATVEATRLARKHTTHDFVVFEAISKSCCQDVMTTAI